MQDLITAEEDAEHVEDRGPSSYSSSPITKLLEKRREMYDVNDVLETQKAKYANEEETFQKVEDDIRARDLHLQHQLVQYNKFLQDNEGKRRRAELRAGEEVHQIAIKGEEIKDMERELTESHRMHKELRQAVARNLRYKTFLELVRDSSEEFSEIQDILARYHTLEMANTDLRAAQSNLDGRAEEMRTKLSVYNKRKAMEILEATNRAASLQADLEDIEKRVMELDEEVKEASEEDAGLRLTLARIVASVENLFKRCTTQKSQTQHGSSIQEDEDADPSTGWGPAPQASRGTGLSQKQKAELEMQEYRKKTDCALKQLSTICAYMADLRDIAEQIKKERKAAKKQQRPVIFDQHSQPKAEIIRSHLPPVGTTRASSSGVRTTRTVSSSSGSRATSRK